MTSWLWTGLVQPVALDCEATLDLCAWFGEDAARAFAAGVRRGEDVAALKRAALARCEGPPELAPCARGVIGEGPLVELHVLRWAVGERSETVVLSRSWEVAEPGLRQISSRRHSLWVAGQGVSSAHEDWLVVTLEGLVEVRAASWSGGEVARTW